MTETMSMGTEKNDTLFEKVCHSSPSPLTVPEIIQNYSVVSVCVGCSASCVFSGSFVVVSP